MLFSTLVCSSYLHTCPSRRHCSIICNITVIRLQVVYKGTMNAFTTAFRLPARDIASGRPAGSPPQSGPPSSTVICQHVLLHVTAVLEFHPLECGNSQNDSRPPCQRSPVRLFARLYTLLPTNELYPLSSFLTLHLVYGPSDYYQDLWIGSSNNGVARSVVLGLKAPTVLVP